MQALPGETMEYNGGRATRSAGVVILIDSSVAESRTLSACLSGYLNVYGALYDVIDLAQRTPDFESLDCSLVILGPQRELRGEEGHRLAASLEQARQGGTGIVGFGPFPFLGLVDLKVESCAPSSSTGVVVKHPDHFITANCWPGEELPLPSSLHLSRSLAVDRVIGLQNGEVLLAAAECPYLISSTNPGGRISWWLDYGWARAELGGTLSRFDVIFLRSLIWAARKPFALRSIPRFVTMRVDDCVGDHGFYRDRAFRWVEIAHEYGFVPWLGFFYEDISMSAFHRLRTLVAEGKATAQFHGRNLFGKHHRRPNEPRAQLLPTLRAWLSERGGPMALSNYLVPHTYDLANEVLPFLPELGVEAVGLPYAVDSGGGWNREGNGWLREGPFRTGIAGSDGVPWSGKKINPPLYYAHWLARENDAPPLFNLLTEIRDVAGYEWFSYGEPDSQCADVPQMIARGAEILRRCLDSRVLATLFTHEDSWRGKFIANVDPDTWRSVVAGIAGNLARYKPQFVSMDEAVKYMTSLHSSRLRTVAVSESAGELYVELDGEAKCPTALDIYQEYENHIVEHSTVVPAFSAPCSFCLPLPPATVPECESIHGDESPALHRASAVPLKLGVAFATNSPGLIEEIRFYCSPGDIGSRRCEIWDTDADRLVYFRDLSATATKEGWNQVELDLPVAVIPGREYAAIVTTVLAAENGRFIAPELPAALCAPLSKYFVRTKRNAGIRMEDFAARSCGAADRSTTSYLRDIVFRPTSVGRAKFDQGTVHSAWPLSPGSSAMAVHRDRAPS